MALIIRWLLHSACNILGYPREDKIEGYPNGEVKKKCLNNLKEVSDENSSSSYEFQMPLHYPRYTKVDYEKMEEWKVELLLKEYGLSFKGSLDEKRSFAMGAFLWPDQY
ncbi:hypothetical protein MtrunA17_Chr2g0290371 [Medicago truncatula]|uniref:DUF7722 domain-containing protein n=1 Tax=Medicago truncatula TaxID=3880 RepID=G7IPB3_MEDTR|nr:uncharacterized protein LOC11410738 [Medicago truncatula]AES64523.1 hypothetical protein MTR_2g026420 [Medicago truncatula]RHN72677.1 hypothetical protein MtrunA17_Chr2g0290371 [Medicago truncatula]